LGAEEEAADRSVAVLAEAGIDYLGVGLATAPLDEVFCAFDYPDVDQLIGLRRSAWREEGTCEAVVRRLDIGIQSLEPSFDVLSIDAFAADEKRLYALHCSRKTGAILYEKDHIQASIFIQLTYSVHPG
jgi:hypothetical protein